VGRGGFGRGGRDGAGAVDCRAGEFRPICWTWNTDVELHNVWPFEFFTTTPTV